MDQTQYLSLRRLCQMNFDALAEALDVQLDDAQRIVLDFFVHKDPDIPLGKLDSVKERLLLYPRGMGKSFLNALDCVQWIICYPNIMIAIQTGGDELATAFVSLAKHYFVVPGWDGKREPNAFCPDGVTGKPIWNENAQPNKFHRLF